MSLLIYIRGCAGLKSFQSPTGSSITVSVVQIRTVQMTSNCKRMPTYQKLSIDGKNMAVRTHFHLKSLRKAAHVTVTKKSSLHDWVHKHPVHRASRELGKVTRAVQEQIYRALTANPFTTIDGLRACIRGSGINMATHGKGEVGVPTNGAFKACARQRDIQAQKRFGTSSVVPTSEFRSTMCSWETGQVKHKVYRTVSARQDVVAARRELSAKEAITRELVVGLGHTDQSQPPVGASTR